MNKEQEQRLTELISELLDAGVPADDIESTVGFVLREKEEVI